MSDTIKFTLFSIPAGTSSIRPELIHGTLYPPTGRVYFCPICAEPWFEAKIRSRCTEAINRHCPNHKPGSFFGGLSMGSIGSTDVPGTLFDHNSPEFNQSWLKVPLLVSYELVIQLAAKMIRDSGEINVASPEWVIYHNILTQPGVPQWHIHLHPHLSRPSLPSTQKPSP